MIKKCVCLILALLFALPAAGCWSYRGLDEMTIVSGIALDKDKETGNYLLSFEFVDLSGSVKENGPESKIIESEGKTIFEAVRNAKKKLRNKLYFGHAQMLIINQDIAKEEDIGSIMDWFMRDGEVRETINMAISREQTAQDIFNAVGIDQKILSIKLRQILETDNKITASTLSMELYNAFETINTPGKDLALAALRTVQNNGVTICEADGIAVFKDRRLVGYLTPEEAKYYLFCIDSVQGGVFTFSHTGEGKDDVTLEINECQTKRSVENRDGQVGIHISVQMYTFLDEIMNPDVQLNDAMIIELEELASKKLRKDIGDLIKKVQSEYGADIFGFGDLIHRTDPQLWDQLKDRWDSLFRTLEVKVETDVHIINTGAICKS